MAKPTPTSTSSKSPTIGPNCFRKGWIAEKKLPKYSECPNVLSDRPRMEIPVIATSSTSTAPPSSAMNTAMLLTIFSMHSPTKRSTRTNVSVAQLRSKLIRNVQRKKFAKNGWGGRIRTCAWRYQKPLPYRLATPQDMMIAVASSITASPNRCKPCGGQIC